METIQLNLFSFSELEDKAKEQALKEFSDINLFDDWYEFTVEDFRMLCQTMGIMVDRSKIFFRGFYSQGDGSTFEANVDVPKLIKAVKFQQWKEYAPNLEFDFTTPIFDERLIRLIQNESLDANPQIVGRERWYSVTADLSYQLPYTNHRYNNLEAELEKLETWLQVIADKLNRCLFKSLQSEYEYQSSEEAVIEGIQVNDYLFTADGKSATRIKNLSKST